MYSFSKYYPKGFWNKWQQKQREKRKEVAGYEHLKEMFEACKRMRDATTEDEKRWAVGEIETSLKLFEETL